MTGDIRASSKVRYDREALVDVLIDHQRASSDRCACGWGELGSGHAEHQVDVYERLASATDRGHA